MQRPLSKRQTRQYSLAWGSTGSRCQRRGSFPRCTTDCAICNLQVCGLGPLTVRATRTTVHMDGRPDLKMRTRKRKAATHRAETQSRKYQKSFSNATTLFTLSSAHQAFKFSSREMALVFPCRLKWVQFPFLARGENSFPSVSVPFRGSTWESKRPLVVDEIPHLSRHPPFWNLPLH